MRILCMEDQEDKFCHIQGVLKKYPVQLERKKSYQTGLMELREREYDYLLLDMSMPLCEDEVSKDNFKSFAGKAVLREIKRKKYQLKVIIVTGFNDFEKGKELITLKELIEEIRVEYGNYYCGYVKYDSTSVEWQERLIALLGLNE